MLLLSAGVTSAWTQAGNGPERTGAMPFEGPASGDVAFQVALPGVPIGVTAIRGEEVEVVTWDAAFSGFDGETEYLTEAALWRIDLGTGEVVRAFDVPEGLLPGPFHLAPDRLLLFDLEESELVLVEVPSGSERWRYQPVPEDPRRHRVPFGLVQVDDTLFYVYLLWGLEPPDGPLGTFTAPTPPAVGLSAIALETGAEHWARLLPIESPRLPAGIAVAADEERVYLYSRQAFLNPSYGISLGDEEVGTRAYESVYEVRALSAGSGATLWTRNDTLQREVGVYTSRGNVVPFDAMGYGCCAYPAVTETAVHIRLDAFEALNPATGESVWTSEAGRSDQVRAQGSDGVGVHDGALVATSTQTVYRLDPVDGDMVWQHTTPDQWFAGMPIGIDGERAYVPVVWPGEDCFLDIGLEARDLETGERLWDWWHAPSVGYESCGQNNHVGEPAYGPGFVVWGSKDGLVHVLGRTGASLGVPPAPAALYPVPGEPFTVTVPTPEPGAFGPATRYRIDWGDGAVSDWQASPAFTHVFNASGPQRARLIAGNDANQTASAVVMMRVGEEEPVAPNMLETAFARENQDLTFGLLGIFVAVTGGAIGVTRRYRQRGRLQAEIDALEEGFAGTRDRPGECEAFLETRKGRARSLVLDGDLSEEQGAIVEARAEELRRSLRDRALREEFGALPYALVSKAREMLEDGRVTSLEAEAFLAALEEVEGLGDELKVRVRDRVEAWLARDAGSGGS